MAEKDVLVFSTDNRVETPVYPHDVFTLTDAGSAQIHGGATRLPAEALAVLVTLDGKRTVGDLEQALPSVASQAVRDLLRSLLSARLVREVTMAELGELELDIGAFLARPAVTQPSAGTLASADREAASGTPLLEENGYYVSFARQALKAAVPPAGGKLNALVVEDDPDVGMLVKRLLDGAGFDTVVAATRDEVLQRLRNAPLPNIVILDVHLPDVNGFDLLQRLKAHPALKAIPTVMLTADATRESVVRGLTMGADGYITKPFVPAVLLSGVNAVLGL